MKRKWDTGDKETERKCAEAIIARVEEQADTTFGFIAAQDIIDIVKDHLAPHIYNKALADVKNITNAKISDLETEIDLLEAS